MELGAGQQALAVTNLGELDGGGAALEPPGWKISSFHGAVTAIVDSSVLTVYTIEGSLRLTSNDGKLPRSARWSTPLSGYRSFGAATLASRASVVFLLPEGAFEYGRFEIVDVEYNPTR